MSHREEFRAYMKAANGTAGSHLSEAQVIAYCRNEMSEAEHQAAETHLVWCEQCIALFRSVRDFIEPARDDEEEITTAETGEAWRSLWAEIEEKKVVEFPRAREKQFLSRAALPLAAGLAISLLALGWQTWRLLDERRSQQEVAMVLENKQRELEQRLSQVEENGREQLQQERDQRLAAEAERDRLQDRLSQQSSMEIPVFTARLSSERGREDDVRVRFSGATKAARLKLLISKPYEYAEYAAEIVDESGKVVMKTSDLRPSGDDGALSLQINRLQSGKYKLRLFGGKERKPLGEYGVSISA